MGRLLNADPAIVVILLGTLLAVILNLEGRLAAGKLITPCLLLFQILELLLQLFNV
jgi:hypothetical protein